MRTGLLFLLSILTTAITAFGQAGPGPDPMLRYGSLVYAEAACFPSDSAGMARVDVFVRIAYDFMIFNRSNGGSPDSMYTGGAEVSSSLRRKGTTVRTQHANIRAAAADYDATLLRDSYRMLRHTYYVEPGRYEVLVEIADRGSTRRTMVRQELNAVLLAPGTTAIGEPVPLRRESDREEEISSVYGFGRSLPFAERALIGVPVPKSYTASWRVRLSHAEDEDDDYGDETVFDGTVQPTGVLPGGVPEGAPGITEEFHLRSSETGQGDLVILALPFEGFDVGRYRLAVLAEHGGGVDSVVIPIEIVWRDMPFSMRDMEFAIDAMRFILTADEYDEMKSGSTREMQRAFRRYWKKRDATPETEHNEMMAEYFRRVDQAYYKFQTLYVRNGVQTDRGKVYVLFGPPEDSHRVMNLEEPIMEIWDYPSIEKSFRFVDKSGDGNLRLMEN